MRLSALALAPLVLLLPLAARAASTPPGLNIRWDQCYGDAGVANKNFACDTNSGSERLVASFDLSAPLAQVVAAEMRVNIVSSSATLPSWWLFYNPGSCRQSWIAATTPPGSVNCVDWASGAASLAIASYQLTFGPNTARMDVVSAVTAENAADVQANQEYLVFQLTINHAKTVGTGACAGCEIPVCINFEHLRLWHSGGITSSLLNQGANTDNSRFVTWQGGVVQNVRNECGPNMGCVTLYDCANPVTPTRGSTWGAVKSLYR